MVDLIQRWVEEQISPWRDRAFDRDVLVDMERQELELFLFSFSGGAVDFKPKPKQPGWNNHRSQLYLSLFREAYSQCCPDLDFKLLLYPGDQRDGSWNYPVFSFLKDKRSNEILVPDVDFMKRKFYASSEFTDPFQPYEKDNRAIFVGSTTGGHEITREKLESNLVPRIKSARFFKDNPRVSFKLPSICQYDSEATREMIVAMDLGKERIPWSEQYRHMFLLSMDGNGATCSRVISSLKSNSVLIKYQSDGILYYFSALEPGTHFISVNDDRDIEGILDQFDSDPQPFYRIAAESRSFYENYLTREKVVEYTGRLFQAYSDIYNSRA